MPFAFLIPGTAQAVFGPGLLTGRLFAILMGLITLLALWWFVRRESGNWWAAAAGSGDCRHSRGYPHVRAGAIRRRGVLSVDVCRGFRCRPRPQIVALAGWQPDLCRHHSDPRKYPAYIRPVPHLPGV